MGSIRIKKIYARRGEEDKVFSSVAEAAEFVKGIKHMIYKCCEGKREVIIDILKMFEPLMG